MPNQIRGFVFTPGVPPQHTNDLRVLEGLENAKHFVWLDVEGEPSTETEAILASILEWHPTVIQNVKLPSARPRLTPIESYTHMIIHVIPGNSTRNGDLRAREMDIVLGDGYLISFHHESMVLVDQLFAEVPMAKPSLKSTDLLLHRILMASVEAMVPEVENLDDAIASLEEDALNHPDPELLERIVHVRNELFQLHLSMAPQLQVLLDLTAGACRFVSPYSFPFFKALENRMRGLIEDVVIYKEEAQNAMELYRSSVTQKTNEIIRVLTVVSTPLLVLSFFTGLYGMNVPLPFSHWPHVFTWMCVFATALFFGMIWWFKKRKWF